MYFQLKMEQPTETFALPTTTHLTDTPTKPVTSYEKFSREELIKKILELESRTPLISTAAKTLDKPIIEGKKLIFATSSQKENLPSRSPTKSQSTFKAFKKQFFTVSKKSEPTEIIFNPGPFKIDITNNNNNTYNLSSNFAFKRPHPSYYLNNGKNGIVHQALMSKLLKLNLDGRLFGHTFLKMEDVLHISEQLVEKLLKRIAESETRSKIYHYDDPTEWYLNHKRERTLSKQETTPMTNEEKEELYNELWEFENARKADNEDLKREWENVSRLSDIRIDIEYSIGNRMCSADKDKLSSLMYTGKKDEVKKFYYENINTKVAVREAEENLILVDNIIYPKNAKQVCNYCKKPARGQKSIAGNHKECLLKLKSDGKKRFEGKLCSWGCNTKVYNKKKHCCIRKRIMLDHLMFSCDCNPNSKFWNLTNHLMTCPLNTQGLAKAKCPDCLKSIPINFKTNTIYAHKCKERNTGDNKTCKEVFTCEHCLKECYGSRSRHYGRCHELIKTEICPYCERVMNMKTKFNHMKTCTFGGEEKAIKLVAKYCKLNKIKPELGTISLPEKNQLEIENLMKKGTIYGHYYDLLENGYGGQLEMKSFINNFDKFYAAAQKKEFFSEEFDSKLKEVVSEYVLLTAKPVMPSLFEGKVEIEFPKFANYTEGILAAIEPKSNLFDSINEDSNIEKTDIIKIDKDEDEILVPQSPERKKFFNNSIADSYTNLDINGLFR